MFWFNLSAAYAEEIYRIKNFDIKNLFYLSNNIIKKFYYLDEKEAIVSLATKNSFDKVRNEFDIKLIDNIENLKELFFLVPQKNLLKNRIVKDFNVIYQTEKFIIAKKLNWTNYNENLAIDYKILPFEEIDGREILRNKIENSELDFIIDQSFGSFSISDIISQVNADSIAKTIKDLQNYGTRWCLNSNRKQIANYIKSRFLNFGFTSSEVKLDSFYLSNLNTWQYNVICEYKGSVNSLKYVVLGGHYDSYSNQNISITAPGADDNASGTAAVIEIARVMKSTGFIPKLTIVFSAFAAEEYGLYGSFDLAKKFKNKQADIKAMINFDMIAYNNPSQNPNNYFFILPYIGAEDLRDLMSYCLKTYSNLKPIYGEQNSSGSDSYSFYSQGYKSVFMFEYIFNPYYHSPSDLFSNIDINYAAEAIKGSLAATIYLSSSPEKVKNFELLDLGDGKKLLARWQKNKNDLATKYKLSIKSQNNSIATNYIIIDTFFIFENLIENQLYEVAIAALTDDDFESPAVFAYQTPKSIPRKPLNFAAKPKKNSILLTWFSNKEIDLKGYKIYKAEENSENYQVVLFDDKNYTIDTFYIDKDIVKTKFYKYKITAVDFDGNESEATDFVKARGIMPIKKRALLINETKNGSGSFYNPTIQQTDNFYSSLLNYNPSEGFYFEIDKLYADSISEINLNDLAIYELVFYNNDDNADYKTIIKKSEEDLRSYINEGGIFIYTGFFPSRAIQSVQGTSSTFKSGDLIFDCFGISKCENKFNSKFIGAYKANQSFSNFPNYIWTDSAKVLSSDNYHLKYVEAIYNRQNFGIVLYKYNTFYDTTNLAGSLKNVPVGINTNRTLVLSFPLYYMRFKDAAELLKNYFVDVFGVWQYSSKVSEQKLKPNEFVLYQNYPNPFNASTTIEFYLPQSDFVDMRIYDILGKEVEVLISDYLQAGDHSCVFNGDKLSSGIYTVIAKTKEKRIAMKIILLK